MLVCAAFVLATQIISDEWARQENDPRWDRNGFNRWAERGCVKFAKLGYLRGLPSADAFPEYHMIPDDGAYVGPPPSYTDVIAIVAGPAGEDGQDGTVDTTKYYNKAQVYLLLIINTPRIGVFQGKA